jgi:hypothetical protein
MLYQVHLAWAGFKLTTLVLIGTDVAEILLEVEFKNPNPNP